MDKLDRARTADERAAGQYRVALDMVAEASQDAGRARLEGSLSSPVARQLMAQPLDQLREHTAETIAGLHIGNVDMQFWRARRDAVKACEVRAVLASDPKASTADARRRVEIERLVSMAHADHTAVLRVVAAESKLAALRAEATDLARARHESARYLAALETATRQQRFTHG